MVCTSFVNGEMLPTICCANLIHIRARISHHMTFFRAAKLVQLFEVCGISLSFSLFKVNWNVNIEKREWIFQTMKQKSDLSEKIKYRSARMLHLKFSENDKSMTLKISNSFIPNSVQISVLALRRKRESLIAPRGYLHRLQSYEWISPEMTTQWKKFHQLPIKSFFPFESFE